MAASVHRILEAEKLVAEELRWEHVFRLVDKTFPPESPEGEVAALLYREHLSQAQVCTSLSIDRQTARRRTDTYICHCAVLAAINGLLKEGEGDAE